MAFPSRDTQPGLGERLQRAQAEAGNLRRAATSLRDFTAANPISANAITGFAENLGASRAVFAKLQGDTALAAFAKSQFEDPAFDLDAELTALTAAIDGIVSWIVAAFPKSAGGFIEKDTLNADGSISVRAFTRAETAGLRAELDKLIAAVS